jgi:hypothetical protein
MAEKRERVAVMIGIASKFLYGFQSPNKDEAAKLALELIEVTAPSKDVAFSPKNIKPFRAYKPGVVARGGLCGYNAVATLQNTGYVLSRKVPNTPKAGLKSVIVGVRLSPNLVFAWRMPNTKWVALPTDIKNAAGIQLATTYPASEIAYHADGFMFTAVNTDLDLPAATYISKASLRKGFTSSGGKYYTVYAGKPVAAGP